jgi:NAD(P)-dependent dehydrogenase (short-subunit alcohol dehydrogenase family)
MTALITGASSGIGLELARIFASHRHDVVLVARTESKLRELARECEAYGDLAHVVPADLSKDNFGPTPPWHDVQARICGPAVDDVAYTFRERWEDPTPLDLLRPGGQQLPSNSS